MSQNVTYIINNINKNNPTAWNFASVSGLTGLPLIFSIIINKICPPSKAGSGKRLIKPTFIDKKENK